jgi:hypothetical protein
MLSSSQKNHHVEMLDQIKRQESSELGVVFHSYNPSTWEAEAGESFRGQPGLHCESLSHMHTHTRTHTRTHAHTHLEFWVCFNMPACSLSTLTVVSFLTTKNLS